MITIKCSCGQYEARFDDQSLAESAAESHCHLGTGHVVTGTRPAHDVEGSVPVILFEFNQNGGKRYDVATEIYRLGRR